MQRVIVLLLIYLPQKDERLSWPSWLTCSRRITHIVVTCRLQAEHRTGSVRRPKTGVLPTVLRNQPSCIAASVVVVVAVVVVVVLLLLVLSIVYYKAHNDNDRLTTLMIIGACSLGEGAGTTDGGSPCPGGGTKFSGGRAVGGPAHVTDINDQQCSSVAVKQSDKLLK